MRRTAVLFALLAVFTLNAQPQGTRLTDDAPDLKYYMPGNAEDFDTAVPTPNSFLGYTVGERFVEWSDVVGYMEALNAASERTSIRYFGKTYESRPFIQLIITSPENQARLEELRKEHLELTDPTLSARKDLKAMPLVVNLMGSIHGNEISGVTALLPVAYYYVASKNPSVKKMLEEMILIVTPGLNPDGINRFSTWINCNSSFNHYPSPLSREYNEPLKSRSNHYWMDCNRDWLSCQFDVGCNCVDMYKFWMPNVVLDLHEKGTKSSTPPYYFSPGDPGRTYKYIPQENQDMTLEISKSTARSLDGIQSIYFSGRSYDDYFIGKGAAYCDIQGSVGILHEQSSTRGHIAEFKKYGVHVFAQTVRNQAFGSYGVVDGAYAIKERLLDYQRRFYENEEKEAKKDAGKAYVFDAGGNRGLAYEIIRNLRRHQIDVYPVNGKENTYAVPLNQKHRLLAKCIFEDLTEFSDSTFYDISTWSNSRAYGSNAVLTSTPKNLGERIGDAVFTQGRVEEDEDAAAYAFSTSEYYSPYLMNALQRQGVELKVLREEAAYRSKSQKRKRTLAPGTVIIPLEGQKIGKDRLCSELKRLAALCGVDVEALEESRDFLISSLALSPVRRPKIGIIPGTVQESGALWFLFDRRYGMDQSVVDVQRANDRKFRFSEFNTIYISGENDLKNTKGLMDWVRNGGTLYLRGHASRLAKEMGAADIHVNRISKKVSKDKVKGVVFNAETKSASPLLWGYTQKDFDLMKVNSESWDAPEETETVLAWADRPYRSGCVSPLSIKNIASHPVLLVKKIGKGAIVFCQVDLAYRSYWLSTSHILTNAAFFGDQL